MIGNGAQHFAAAFREDMGLDCPLLVDPELRAYRAAGLRRGRVELLSPRLPLNAMRALRAGYRQTSVQGDPWQLGGVFVIRPDATLAYRHASREAGDHAPIEAIVAALDPDAPAIAEGPRASQAERWLGRGLSQLVDPTVVLSFDRTGFRIHALAFRPDDLDVDLAGRRCLVTGANSGIGFETALALADLGAEVVLLCRSRERGEAAATRIREQTGNRRVTVEELDVSRLAAVRDGRGATRAAAGRRARAQRGRAAGRTRARPTTASSCASRRTSSDRILLTRLLRPALERVAGCTRRLGRVGRDVHAAPPDRRPELEEAALRRRRRLRGDQARAGGARRAVGREVRGHRASW